MKKRVLVIVSLLVLMLTIPTYAVQKRAPDVLPGLSFNGTTALMDKIVFFFATYFFVCALITASLGVIRWRTGSGHKEETRSVYQRRTLRFHMSTSLIFLVLGCILVFGKESYVVIMLCLTSCITLVRMVKDFH